MPKSLLTLEQRFWAKVDTSGDCWTWTGCRTVQGYGQFRAGSKLTGAHRFSFILANGLIPADKIIMHSCDNPSCVNPDHLSLGTNHENILDKFAKGRGWQQRDKCSKGHAYTPENTRHIGRERRCIICSKANKAAFRLRKKLLIQLEAAA